MRSFADLHVGSPEGDRTPEQRRIGGLTLIQLKRHQKDVSLYPSSGTVE